MIDTNGATLLLESEPGDTDLLLFAVVRPNQCIGEYSYCSSSQYHVVAA